jgi:hypothetical protein
MTHTANCRTAESSLALLTGTACSSSLAPLPTSIVRGAGARPEHPIADISGVGVVRAIIVVVVACLVVYWLRKRSSL